MDDLEYAPASVQAFVRRRVPIYVASSLFKRMVTAYRAARDDDSGAGWWWTLSSMPAA